MDSKASIWHHGETPGYHKGKRDTSWSKWRVLVMERLAQLTGRSESEAVQRMDGVGLHRLGVAYDDDVTAEEMAAQLAR